MRHFRSSPALDPHNACPSQRRAVDDGVNPESLREDQGVGERKSSFGVCVDNLRETGIQRAANAGGKHRIVPSPQPS